MMVGGIDECNDTMAFAVNVHPPIEVKMRGRANIRRIPIASAHGMNLIIAFSLLDF